MSMSIQNEWYGTKEEEERLEAKGADKRARLGLQRNA